MLDHTLLAPGATPADIERLCDEARQHGFAAVCVNGAHVRRCARRLQGSPVKVCAVVGFPLGAGDPLAKSHEAHLALESGALELDMVLQIGALRAGEHAFVVQDIQAVVTAAHASHGLVKVILETGLLAPAEIVSACRLAQEAGADFVKTSTGKVTPASTLPVVLLMLEAVRDHFLATGRQVGVKAAGGIRTSKDALRYLVLVNETCGDLWMSARWFRFGASSLLNDVLMQLEKERLGRYQRPGDFSVD